MNKRQKTKQLKKKVELLKPGQGLIIGNGNSVTHHHPIGSIVEIESVQSKYVNCYTYYTNYWGELRRFNQGVSRKDIIIKE